MGREQPSFQPTHPSRDDRAKRAKVIINKTIPTILKGNARARRGVEAAELIVDPSPLISSQHGTAFSHEQQNNDTTESNEVFDKTRSPPVKISLRVTDTLQAAHQLGLSTEGQGGRRARVAILNMASPLRPGGGVLSGASSQEEWLCTRTTLYPSLREEFYRLPEVGGVYTPDVLVFRGWNQAASELDKKDRFYVDAISAAMLRFPDIEGEGEESSYAEQKDRDLVISKMRAVLRIVRLKGAEKIVLGAWGCGAYGNPVGEIARAWKKVLLGSKSRRNSVNKKKGTKAEDWNGLEIVFAIKDYRMAKSFARAFGEDLSIEEPHSPSGENASVDNEEEEEEEGEGGDE